MSLSIVIPTYGRDEVLTDTIAQLLAQSPPAAEILVVDQTRDHGPPTTDQLESWHSAGAIRWLRLTQASQPLACNVGLRQATESFVLFLDDDIRVGPGFLAAHLGAFTSADIWAVVGQVLQPEDWGKSAEHTEDAEGEGDSCGKDGKLGRERGEGLRDDRTPDVERSLRPPSSDLRRPARRRLTADLDFRFNGGRPAWVTNGMSGNLCVRRERALAIGGFDENYRPPVSYRFDSDFCKRLVAAGGGIRFEPRASINHLRASRGGTRSLGSHLTSASPIHGVGDYYYALRCGQGWERLHYILRRPFREVRTRFHLRHPWYIPVKLLGELRALLLALRLWRRGPRLLPTDRAEGK